MSSPYMVHNHSLSIVLGNSDYLGYTSVPVWVVEKHGEISEQWASLKDVSNGKILMSLSWLNTTKDNSTLKSKNPLFLPNRKGIFMNQTTFLLFNVHTHF